MFKHINPYLQLMRLDKPIGIYLLLWPTLIALWLASKGWPHLDLLCIFAVGTLVMRSAGCVINDIIDQKFDAHVERTKSRPLPSGRVTTRQALRLFFWLLLCAALLALQLNRHTLWLACLGAVITIIYPTLKRFISIPQLGIGVAFAWGVPMAFSAVGQTIDMNVMLLYCAVLCWILAYDTAYAMSDREDDEKIGVRSSARWLGRYDVFVVTCFQFISLALFAWVGVRHGLGLFYLSACMLAGLLSVRQHYQIRQRDRRACFQAFKDSHWYGCVLWLGVVISLWQH